MTYLTYSYFGNICITLYLKHDGSKIKIRNKDFMTEDIDLGYLVTSSPLDECWTPSFTVLTGLLCPRKKNFNFTTYEPNNFKVSF